MSFEIPATSYTHYAGSGPLIPMGGSPYIHDRDDWSYLSNPADGNNVFAVTFPGVPAGPVSMVVRGWVLSSEYDFFAGVNVGDGVTDNGGGNYSLHHSRFFSFSAGWNEYTGLLNFNAPGGDLTVYASMGFAIDHPDTTRISYMAIVVDTPFEEPETYRRVFPRDDRRNWPRPKAWQAGSRRAGGYL